MERRELQDGIIKVAEKAGRILLDAKKPHITAKEGHANFVTEYDRKIQEFIFAQLHSLMPQAGFIGEEEGKDSTDHRDGFFFCVDPIDGTSNFIAGYFPSVISIALLEDGRPIIGVIHNPYASMTFSAVRGMGTFLNSTPVQSSDSPLSLSLVGFGTSPYNPEFTEDSFNLCKLYLPRCVDLRRSGSAAWDLCCVACGQTGLFFEMKLGLWDYAAGAVIAEEAGCTITDLQGNALDYAGPSSILCASRGVSKETYLPSDLIEF